MVHRGMPGSLRHPEVPSSCPRGRGTKQPSRGTAGGDSPVRPADAVRERRLDAAALCHCTFISHCSRDDLSLPYLLAARSSCSLVACVARSECAEDLLKLAGKDRGALARRAALAGDRNVREWHGEDTLTDPRGYGNIPAA